MAGYNKSDELYHFGRSKKDGAPGVGTGNWRRKGSPYEYADGKKTPLARFKESDKSKMTGAEKLQGYRDAILETAAGHGLIRYKKTTETIKGDSKLTKAMKKQALEDKRRADEAFAARVKEKEEKIKKKAEEVAERVKREEAAQESRRQAAEKARQEQAEAIERQKLEDEAKNKKYAEARNKQVDEWKEEVKENAIRKEAQMHEDNVNQAKQNRWDKFSDEDLANYVNRVNLEAKATEAMLLKMDAPRKVIAEISQYGKTALEAYGQYKNVMDTVKSFKNKTVQPTSVPDSYAQIVKKQTFDYMQEQFGKNPNATVFNKDELQNWIDIINKINQLDPLPKN